MLRPVKFAGALLSIVLLMAGSIAAQDKRSTTRAVQGVVTDASGNPVNKAIVQLKDTKTLQVRSYITQQDGAYHFAGLSTNVDYELKAEHNGAESDTKTLSIFDNRPKAVINLKLKK
jgi:hypothetical protein